MEKARQYSPLGRAKLKAAYRSLFWAALAALTATFAAWFIDRRWVSFAFCSWLLVIVVRAAIVVFDGARSGSIIYAPDRFDSGLQPWSYRAAMIINSLVILAAFVLGVLVMT